MNFEINDWIVLGKYEFCNCIESLTSGGAPYGVEIIATIGGRCAFQLNRREAVANVGGSNQIPHDEGQQKCLFNELRHKVRGLLICKTVKLLHLLFNFIDVYKKGFRENLGAVCVDSDDIVDVGFYLLQKLVVIEDFDVDSATINYG